MKETREASCPFQVELENAFTKSKLTVDAAVLSAATKLPGLALCTLFKCFVSLIFIIFGFIQTTVRKWKEGMEKKGPRVNAGKTKIMWCKVSMGQTEDSGEHPCGVCRKGVGDNSI